MRQDGIDRLSIRKRPGLVPLMHQSWCKLLFMHWQLRPELLRPHIPPQLQIDTCDGKAWLGITPFTVRDMRPPFLPSIPWLSRFNELNVRTYVHYDGVPGVWFFSLDADSLMAVWGARAGFHLPYRLARMTLREEGDRIFYTSRRAPSPAGPAELEACWKKGEYLGEAAPGTLEFFLVERYCLYAVSGNDLYRARIHHWPWKLHTAQLVSCRSMMLEGQGLPNPQGEPLLHYSELQPTSIWPLKKVRGTVI